LKGLFTAEAAEGEDKSKEEGTTEITENTEKNRRRNRGKNKEQQREKSLAYIMIFFLFALCDLCGESASSSLCVRSLPAAAGGLCGKTERKETYKCRK
jgi:hypothetical protein